MSRLILTNLDLNKNELQNARVQNLGTPPSSPVAGQLYFDTSTSPGILYVYDGSAWQSAQAAAGLTPSGTVASETAFGQSAAAGVATSFSRGDHSHGTPTHDTAAHAAVSRSGLAAPTADISWAGFKLTSLGTPTAAADAATKSYVDATAAGIDWKASVRVATTGNVTLSGTQTIDGVALAAGDRVLVKNQAAAAENGIYVVAVGAWARATDADTSAEVTSGTAVFVASGTQNLATAWVLTTADPITLGTTALTWTQFSGPGTYLAGTGLSLTGTTFALSTPVAIALGGTGAATAAAARANLGVPGKYTTTVGNGSATAFTITQATHGLASDSTNVVQVTDASSGAVVWPDVAVNPANGTVTLTFAVAPATNAYRVTVVG